MSTGDPVLLYDGACGLCSRSVAFVLSHERRHTLRFAPLDSAWARRCIEALPQLADVDSVIWVDFNPDGQPASAQDRSAAALRVARYLGGPWPLLGAFWLVPRPLRDRLYNLVARHRHRLPGDDSPVLVPEAARHRFIVDG